MPSLTNDLVPNNFLWLWVPAFAGTTGWENPSMLARAHIAEQKPRDLPLLDFLAAFGDAVAAVMAVDVFERLVARVAHATVDLHGAVLYHCGPVMLKQGERWVVKAAGPTTSSREEPYQADVIKRYGVRAVIGKGGMGPKTLAYGV